MDRYVTGDVIRRLREKKNMTQEERLWLESWGERCGIRIAASFMPQYAGNAPVAGNARHGNLVDARGPRLR